VLGSPDAFQGVPSMEAYTTSLANIGYYTHRHTDKSEIPKCLFLGDSHCLDDGSPIGLPFQKRFQLSIEVKVRVCIRSR
jgi:hypothetical protein